MLVWGYCLIGKLVIIMRLLREINGERVFGSIINDYSRFFDNFDNKIINEWCLFVFLILNIEIIFVVDRLGFILM